MALIQADVFERIIEEKLKGKEKLVSLATNLGNLNNGVQAGETHKFVKFAHIGEPVDLVKGESIATEELQSTETEETVRHIAKGVVVYDRDKYLTLDGQSMVDRGASQLADVFVRALEKDLASKLVNAPLKYATSLALDVTATEINNAIAVAFGDDQDTADFAGIVINSKLAPKFYAMEEFVDVNKTYQSNSNGIVRNGVIGYFRGIPVIMSDVATYDSTKAECITYVLKRGAFGYKTVKGFNTEVARNASKKADEIYSDLIFVTGIIDDTALVVMRKTIV